MISFNIDISVSAKDLVEQMSPDERAEMKVALGIDVIHPQAEKIDMLVDFFKYMDESAKYIFKMKCDSYVEKQIKMIFGE